MQVNLNKLRNHIAKNKDILSDNNILFKSTHKRVPFFSKNRKISSQLVFLFIYFSKISIKLVYSNKNIWLNQSSDSNFIIYYQNYKYSNFANTLSALRVLNNSSILSYKILTSTIKNCLIHKSVRFCQYIYILFWIVKSLTQRSKRFQYCSYGDIIHCFRSLEALLYLKWRVNNNINYTLVALNSDSITSAIHHYSNIRVVNVYCEYFNNNIEEFKNYNCSEKVVSFSNIEYDDFLKIGAIPPLQLTTSPSSSKLNIYIVDTCDIENVQYNEYRRNILQKWYSSSDLLNYDCNHVFHPGLSRDEYSQTLEILPKNVKIIHGLSKIQSVPQNALIIGFQSTALLAFAFIRCKVFTFSYIDNFIFDNQFKNIPCDLSSFNVQSLLQDDNDPNVVYDNLNFYDFTEFIEYLNLYSDKV